MKINVFHLVHLVNSLSWENVLLATLLVLNVLVLIISIARNALKTKFYLKENALTPALMISSFKIINVLLAMQIVLLVMALYLMTVYLVSMAYFTRIECVLMIVIQGITKILKQIIALCVILIAKIVWDLLKMNVHLVYLLNYFFSNQIFLLLFLLDLVKYNAPIKHINT
jgi:hypothetical protein